MFAVNINVFWTTRATEELARIREALAPGGRLYLFYETPTANRARDAATRVAEALQANGFIEPEILVTAANLVCCVSQPSGAFRFRLRRHTSVFRCQARSCR